MENKDFDNIFSNKLGDLQEENFTADDASWDKLEGILNDRNILPPQKRKWLGLVPIIFLLLLSNLWFGWKYLSVDSERTRLQTKVTDLDQELINYKTQLKEVTTDFNSRNKSKSNKETNTFLSENQSVNRNSVKTEIKIVERVVEKIVYIPRPVFTDLNGAGNLSLQLPSSFSIENTANEPNSKFSFNSKNNGNTLNIAENYGDTTTDNFYISDKWTNSLNFIDVEAESGNSDGNLLGENTLGDYLNFPKLGENILNPSDNSMIKDQILGLEILPLNELKNKIEDLDSIKYVDNKKEYQVSFADRLTMLGYSFAPKSYEAGINGNASYGVSDQYHNRITSGFGLEGSVIFKNKIKLNTQINYANITYEANDIWGSTYSDEWFIALPDLVGYEPEDQVNRVKAYQHMIEIPIMVEYPLFSNKSWSPFIGFGVKARYHVAQKFEYEFLEAPYFDRVYGMPYVNTTFSQFGINTINGTLGADFYTMSNWILRVRLNYSNDFNGNGFDNKRYQDIGAGLGILYQFD